MGHVTPNPIPQGMLRKSIARWIAFGPSKLSGVLLQVKQGNK